MNTRTVMLLVFFVIITWLGSAGFALATVELSGGGEQGPPGPQGEQGAAGPRGPAGSSGTLTDSPTRSSLEALATMWAVGKFARDNPGEAIRGTHPGVQACVDFIMDGEGSFVECGFERAP